MGSEWPTYKLSDLSELITKGTTPTTMGHKYTDAGINFVKSESITFDGWIDASKFAFIDEDGHEALKRSKLQDGDILFSMAGVYIGKTAVVPPRILPANTNQAVGIIRLDQHKAWPRFIDFYLRNPTYNQFLNNLVSQSAQPNLNLTEIRNLPIHLPPLPEQKAIAHILGTLDDKVESNRRMNATLEGMAQALFKSWFVDFDPVIDNALAAGNPIPDELAPRAEVRKKALANSPTQQGSVDHPTLSDPRSLFPAAFQFTEELGWIPEGWEANAVSKAIHVNPTTKLKKGDLAPFADMKALPISGYAIDGVIEKAYSGGAKFQNGDVILARITPCLENGKTGIVDFLTDDDPVGFGSTEFIVLRGEGDLSTAFIACLARDSDFRKHCEQSMIGSSGRQRVHNSCFDTYHVALPKDRQAVCQFNALAVPAFAKSTSQSSESKTLANLRDTLLPKLVSGELHLPEAAQLTEEALA